MPVISFSYSDFTALLGKELARDEFSARAPMLGCDINKFEGDLVELEFFPNRPDLYSVEGVARAMKAFLGLRPGMPRYEVNDSNIDLELDESVTPVRPYVVCGIVRDIHLDDAAVRSIMDMQEKLHVTVGRLRRKVSVGIHDLDRVKPPFVYKAVEPGSISFVPLACTEEMNLCEILERHDKGIAYASILDGMEKYPVILDREGSVLSFPPIINGVLTQVTGETKNLFLDVTGTDYAAVNLTLNIISTALAERGCRLESVVMRYPKRAPFRTPSLLSRKRALSPSLANRLLGTDITVNDMMESLRRMMYDASLADASIEVGIPAFRADVLHEVDLVEDLAIGHGFQNLQGGSPRAMTFGRELASSFRDERARQSMIGLGYNEMMSFCLTSPAKQFPAAGGRPAGASEVQNPVTEDQTILRPELAPSLLELLRINKHHDLPQRLFEVGEAVVDHKNRRRLAAVFIHPRASFTEAKALAEAVLRELGMEGRYLMKPHDRPEFIKGRCASIVMTETSRTAGWFGEYHPKVVVDFELGHPAGGLELELDELDS
jgi:phenylalanyl-tRNA synthetase beta chain